MSRRATRGQALIIVALLSAVLVGIVGLSIDGGEVAGEQELVQASADGAALAGAYDAAQGSTQAAATLLATLVVQKNGLAASSLTMSYLNSGGGIVAGPGTTGVAIVQAIVFENRPTFFLGALGITTVRVTATGRASVKASGTAPCAVCVMPGSGVTYHQQHDSVVTITGAPAVINSTSSGNLTMDRKAQLTAPSILLGSLTQSVFPNASVTPNPTVGTATDPLAALGYPTVSGVQPDFTNASGTNALTPGIYRNVTITGGTVTMSGAYVITGLLSVSGGTLSATGALLFLACAGYPSACPAGTAGGVITTTGGSVNLAAQTSGLNAGLAVFADRNNAGANSFTNTSLTVTGTYYTAGSGLSLNNNAATQNLNSLVDVASLLVAPNTTVAVTYLASQNAGSGQLIALAP